MSFAGTARNPIISTEREEEYIIALANTRSHIRRRVSEPNISNDGRLELLDLLSRLDDILNGGEPPEDHDNDAPDQLSGSF